MFWFWASQGSCRSWNGINSSSSYSPSLGSWIPTDPVTSPWWVLQRQAKNAQNGYLAWLPFRNWQELGSSRASHGSTNTSWITNGWPVQSTFRDVRTVLQRKEEDQDHQQNRQTYVRRGGSNEPLGTWSKAAVTTNLCLFLEFFFTENPDVPKKSQELYYMETCWHV